MTSRKTIALTKQTFVGKVMSLLFNMLSRLIIAFLSRSKFLLISWLQSPSTVILELPHPWDSPGKNTGVGCHFLLQCRKVKSESEDAQSCPTLHDPMDCSLPGSSIHGIFQARVLVWGAIAFSIPRSKRLLISWLQSPSAVILEPKKIKSDAVSTVSPSVSHEVMGPDSTILVFWMLSFKPLFHSPLSLSSRGFLVPLHFLP